MPKRASLPTAPPAPRAKVLTAHRPPIESLRARVEGSSPAKMMAAAAAVVRELEELEHDSTKMRVLAMASAAYGREPDATWFLEAATEPGARSPRCSRCGHVHGKTRAHW